VEKEKEVGLGIVFIGLVFAIFLVLNTNGSITSFTVSEVGSYSYLISAKDFKVLDIEKSERTVLEISLVSDNKINVFAEIDDCDKWKEGNDDGVVLESINEVREGNIRIGDPSKNTKQSLELYNAEKVCLIFVNTEIDKITYVSALVKEVDKNKWKIVR
jgi:hypothetical protein